jgi:hypothetical protein
LHLGFDGGNHLSFIDEGDGTGIPNFSGTAICGGDWGADSRKGLLTKGIAKSKADHPRGNQTT